MKMNELIMAYYSIVAKGQLISKELLAILEFFQKTNETIQS